MWNLIFMIPMAKPYFDEKETLYVQEAVKSTWVSSKGSFLDTFSKKFAAFCNVKYASTISNGTAALHLALLALGVGHSHEVIVPDFTFAATATAVLHANAKPVLVDVERETGCITADAISKKITKRTKAIIPVHLYGHPCKMDEIMELANRHDISVVEDAAESHGAEVNKRRVGSFGHISCFSFYGNKIITTGEGGMCVTDDNELYAKMELLKNHGMTASRRYWHDVLGYNYRMTNLQAAVGVAQMEKIDFFINERIRIAKSYVYHLSDLKKQSIIELPACKPWAKNVYWMFNILIKNSKVSKQELMKSLVDSGIESRPFFYPLHRMPPYHSNEKFPVSDYISDHGISLPSYAGMEEKDIDYICDCIKKALS